MRGKSMTDEPNNVRKFMSEAAVYFISQYFHCFCDSSCDLL